MGKLDAGFRFIDLAIQQAKQSRMDVRVGAVLFRQKHVIGAGYNKADHPLLYTGKVEKLHVNHGMHAEIAAVHSIVSCKEGTLVVVRLRKDNSIGLAKPCRSCQRYLGRVGIKRVIYSDNIGDFNIMKV